METTEDDRKNKNADWLLSHPRKLCMHCWEWRVCSGEPWDDVSGCHANTGCIGNYYLLGYADDCKFFYQE